MYIIITSNSYHDLVAFGPYESREAAKVDIARLDRKHPSLNHLALEVDSDYVHTLPPLEAKRLGSRPVMGGMYEKDMDTGEVRERPDYDYISDFPG